MIQRSHRRPWLLAALLCVLCAAILLAACGSDDSSSGSGDGGTDPATVVPAGSPAYVSVDVHPTGERKANVQTLSQALFGVSDPGAAIVDLLESNDVGGQGLDFDKDIKPWLGDHVAAALTSAQARSDDVLLVAASSDDGKAEDALKDASKLTAGGSYRDVDYRKSSDGKEAAAVLDGAVVFGSERTVRQAIDAVKDGATLASSDRFRAARAKVQSDALATVFLDAGKLIGVAAAAGGQAENGQLLQGLVGDKLDGIAATVDAGPSEILLKAATTGFGNGAVTQAATSEEPAAALAELPGEAWLGVGLGDLGRSLQGILDGVSAQSGVGGIGVAALLGQVEAATGLNLKRDLLSWMGPAGIFVEGTTTSSVGGGLVVHVKDEAQARRAVAKLQRVLPQLLDGLETSPIRGGGVDRGFTLKGPGTSLQVSVALKGDRFVLAIGPGALRDALGSGPKLGEAPGLVASAGKLGPDEKPSLYADVTKIDALVASAAKGGDPSTQTALNVLDKLTQIVAGTNQDGDTTRASAVIGVDTTTAP